MAKEGPIQMQAKFRFDQEPVYRTWFDASDERSVRMARELTLAPAGRPHIRALGIVVGSLAALAGVGALLALFGGRVIG
jgi:hypothetical protein